MVVQIMIFHLALLAQTPAPTPQNAPADPEAAKTAAESADAMVYTYNPFGKRDPFKSFLSERVGTSGESENPLLAWDLSRFTLTGILWGVANPKAIVKDGAGRGHIISRGTRMGRNRGQVVRILKSEVVIQEEFRDPLGKLVVSEYSMKLEKDDMKTGTKR